MEPWIGEHAVPAFRELVVTVCKVFVIGVRTDHREIVRGVVVSLVSVSQTLEGIGCASDRLGVCDHETQLRIVVGEVCEHLCSVGPLPHHGRHQVGDITGVGAAAVMVRHADKTCDSDRGQGRRHSARVHRDVGDVGVAMTGHLGHRKAVTRVVGGVDQLVQSSEAGEHVAVERVHSQLP